MTSRRFSCSEEEANMSDERKALMKEYLESEMPSSTGMDTSALDTGMDA